MFSYNGDLHQTKFLAEDFIITMLPFFFGERTIKREEKE